VAPRDVTRGRKVRLKTRFPWDRNDISERLTRPVRREKFFSRQQDNSRSLLVALANKIVALEETGNTEDGRPA
jgi:hypothetical protein